MSALNIIAQARHDGMCEGQINASGTLMLRLADALEEAQARAAELEGELRVIESHGAELSRANRELQAQLERATSEGCAFARELGAMTIAYETLRATEPRASTPHAELIAKARHDGMCEGQVAVSGTLMLQLADALSEAGAEPRPMSEAPEGRIRLVFTVVHHEGRAYSETPDGWLPTSSGGGES